MRKSTKLRAGLLAMAGVAILSKVISDQPLRVLKSKANSITYSREYIIANMRDGTYERYEHQNYDGSKACMQFLKHNGIFLDNSYGRCDDAVDTRMYGSSIDSCRDDICESIIRRFKDNNAIEELLRIWDREKRKCNKLCKITFE